MTPPPPLPSRHSLWGRVVDADGGRPPPSVIYWLRGDHGGAALPIDLHPVGWSDREGRFCARDLPPGEGLLLADCEAYAAGLKGARRSAGERVTLPRSGAEGDLELRYPISRSDFASIHGRVAAAEDGRPLRGQSVQLADTASGGVKFRMETRSDREGGFEFEWLPPGKYTIGVMATLARVTEGGTLSKALRAGDRVACAFQVPKRPAGGPRFAAAVRCVDEAGAPVAGAEVMLQAVNFHALPLLAGEDGAVRTGEYPVLPFRAVATKAGYRTADAALEAKDGGARAEGTVVLRREAALRVVVLDDATGRPLPRARIAVEHPGGDIVENIDLRLNPPMRIPGDGGFDYAVLPGRADVTAGCPGYEPGDVSLDVAAGGVPEAVTLRLKPRELLP